jgi:hypothetical protein
VEIKPDSQKDLGERQASAYVEGLQKMFAAKGMNMFKEGRMAYFQKCLSEDKKMLDIDDAVEDYNFCSTMTPSKLAVEIPEANVASEALGD